MRIKAIEKELPIIPRKKGNVITARILGDTLILDVFADREYIGRQCVRTNGEFAQYKDGKWRISRLYKLLGLSSYWHFYTNVEEKWKIDGETVEKWLAMTGKRFYGGGTLRKISSVEDDWQSECYRQGLDRKEQRRLATMRAVRQEPDDWNEWMRAKVPGHYLIGGVCTACGRQMKAGEGSEIRCECGELLQVRNRKKTITEKRRAILMQGTKDPMMGVIRHYEIKATWTKEGKSVATEELVRMVLYRRGYDFGRRKQLVLDIFYESYGWFDNESNKLNRRMKTGYLYADGIGEALENTMFERWTNIFEDAARRGLALDYNRLLAAQNGSLPQVAEYLIKGRYEKLMEDTADSVSLFFLGYSGQLNLHGDTPEEIMGIDRQRMLRLRAINGGNGALKWLKWEARTGRRLTDETLRWLESNKIATETVEYFNGRMSPEQIMNYVERQKRESYKRHTAQQVIAQWRDYLDMCEKAQKNTADALVYRPRELKRRHDEMVRTIEAMQDEIKADEMSARFPGAEKIMEAVRDKYAYENDEYMIYIPKRLIEIVEDARKLHHCAGATDRYFDRIMHEETYICLLRKRSEPDVPFYTIEVEPGGTIRQHRGYLDEEPDIEKVKPFLREWQKEIKQRMSARDRKLQEESARLRMENIRDLISRNNQRVLQGLMEDFMEAI